MGGYPCAPASPSIAPSPTVTEFALRRNVQMHDGTTLDAEDVAFSLNRVFKESDPRFMGANGRFFYNFDRVEVVDRFSVRVVTKRPEPLLETLLGTSLGLLSGILGGIVDTLLMMLVDVQISIPFLLVVVVGILLLESSLSFLGIGVQPPTASLGRMVGEGRDYLMSAWWVVAAPAGLILIVTLIVQLAGDWLRDVLDVRLGK